MIDCTLAELKLRIKEGREPFKVRVSEGLAKELQNYIFLCGGSWFNPLQPEKKRAFYYSVYMFVTFDQGHIATITHTDKQNYYKGKGLEECHVTDYEEPVVTTLENEAMRLTWYIHNTYVDSKPYIIVVINGELVLQKKQLDTSNIINVYAVANADIMTGFVKGFFFKGQW
jgi:hypothetical protein